MTRPLGIVCTGLFVLLAFAATAPADDAKDKKKTDLEGTWKAVKKDAPVKQIKFTGHKFEATIHGKKYKGTFKLNDDENPSHIDLKIAESEEEKHKGKTALGIYEFQGDNIRWCSSQPGRKRRPGQFVKVMGDARLLLVTLKKAR